MVMHHAYTLVDPEDEYVEASEWEEAKVKEQAEGVSWKAEEQ